jgi:hypothetical protein
MRQKRLNNDLDTHPVVTQPNTSKCFASNPHNSTTRHRPAGLLNENYLTSNGQTVPRPGVSQGASPSRLDRRIEERDNRIDLRICSNCD